MWFPLLMLLALVGAIAAFALVGYGLGTLGRARVRGTEREVWLRCVGALLGAVAAVVYAWGLLLAAGAVLDVDDGGSDSSPPLPCRIPGQEERARDFVGYRVDFVPLRFVCETEGGGSYPAQSVPGYVTPVVLGFALAAAVCAGTAAVGSKRRTEARTS